MQKFETSQTTICYETMPAAAGSMEDLHLIWAHGWGQDHNSFTQIINTIRSINIINLDLPGFGKSSAPAQTWGTADYAETCAALLETLPGPKIWIGHSFGGRIGLQIAASYPELLNGLFLIGSAGLKPARPLWAKFYIKAKVKTYKTLKKLTALGVSEEWLKSRFGSADYRNADPVMRAILVKTVNEDLSATVPHIRCPVRLVYGEKDTETPPEIGQRLERLIPDARLTILPGLDHYTILSEGRHQVGHLLNQFIKEIPVK